MIDFRKENTSVYCVEFTVRSPKTENTESQERTRKSTGRFKNQTRKHLSEAAKTNGTGRTLYYGENVMRNLSVNKH